MCKGTEKDRDELCVINIHSARDAFYVFSQKCVAQRVWTLMCHRSFHVLLLLDMCFFSSSSSSLNWCLCCCCCYYTIAAAFFSSHFSDIVAIYTHCNVCNADDSENRSNGIFECVNKVINSTEVTQQLYNKMCTWHFSVHFILYYTQ